MLCLRKGAKETDGTIHLAFIHDFSKFSENGQIDKRAIDAMGNVLAGSDEPFIVTSGTPLVAPGRLATEEDPVMPGLPRVSENGRTSLCRARCARHGSAVAAGTWRRRQIFRYDGDVCRNGWRCFKRARAAMAGIEADPDRSDCRQQRR